MPKFSLRTLLLIIGGFAAVLAIGYLAIQNVREEGRRGSCGYNVRNATLAMRNFESANGCLPIGIETTADGTPFRSWRTRLYPYYAESSPAYYDPDHAWDSPTNARLYDGSPVVQVDKFGSNRRVEPLDPCPSYWFCCPSDHTKRVNYAVVIGTETAFPPNRNVKLEEITDGLENTILVIETLSGSDKWTEPRDLQFDSMSFTIGHTNNGEAASKHAGGVHAGFADGSVHFLTDGISPEELKALLTIAGNEPITRQQLIDRGVIE